ncbi:MAG: adenylate/guanylate cyclase domain-containing protein [Sneathiella sp.]|nr:adenylate/guanylate cyclase domain-containing protein [Sneathiella sp.]
MDNILTAYLGKTPSEEILKGATQRGDGSTTRAVIWICDLRKSTELAFKLNEKTYLSLLNKFLEYMANTVFENNGEILKFLGDGFLAIFPASDECQEEQAALNAVNAALQAEVNFDRTFEKDGLSGFGIGIHLGNVMFGNIGTPERLDFSVIGPAVNIASRLQDLTKTLPSSILVSEDIASKIDTSFICHSNQVIRGSNLVMDVFSPK